MEKVKKIVFATNNRHKLEEVRQIVGDRIEILSLEEIGCRDDIPETATTLAGNALLKARWVKEHYGYDCFADDTGLMVDALDGAPGVHTARYAGDDCNPTENVKKLLREMLGIENRSARFCTVIALLLDGEEHIMEGCVEGNIALQPGGSAGFGYDPVFIPEDSQITFAEMTAEAKNAISHRGRAMEKLMNFLSNI